MTKSREDGGGGSQLPDEEELPAGEIISPAEEVFMREFGLKPGDIIFMDFYGREPELNDKSCFKVDLFELEKNGTPFIYVSWVGGDPDLAPTSRPYSIDLFRSKEIIFRKKD